MCRISSCPLPASPKCDDGAAEFGGGAEFVQNDECVKFRREANPSPHFRLTSFCEAQMGGLRGAKFEILHSQ